MSTKILLWFDVEDYVNEISDDAFLALLDMLDAIGVRASLKMVAEKARVLKARGRYDILKKLCGHEICYHTENHSRHPITTEFCEPLSFTDGVLLYEKLEAGGIATVRDITGRFPKAFGQAGLSWSPCVFPVLKKYGIDTYLDEHKIIDCGGEAFYYGGLLTLNNLSRMIRCDYETPDGLDRAKARFDELNADESNKTKVFSIYYHPCEFICDRFWDAVNFDKVNPENDENGMPKYKPSPLASTEEMYRRLSVLRDFILFTLSRGDTEYITIDELSKYELHRGRTLNSGDCTLCAQQILHSGGIDYTEVGGEYLCASEIFSLLERKLNGRTLTTELVYGPERREKSIIRSNSITRDSVAAALSDYDSIYGYKRLRSLYSVGDNLLTPTALLHCAAQLIINGGDTAQVAADIPLLCERCVDKDDDWRGKWIFPEDFRIPGTVENTALGTWTLKPARF